MLVSLPCDRSTLSEFLGLLYCFAEMFLKKLVGRTDMENALQRLENMTQEETRMASAEALKAIHSVGDKVGDKMQDALKAVHDKVGGVEGMLQGFKDMLEGSDKVQGVDDRIKDVGDKVINRASAVLIVMSAVLIVFVVRC